MAETEQLKIQIVLDDGSIKEGFIDIEKKAKKTGDGIGDKLSAGAKTFAASLAAAFTVGKVVSFFKSAVREAAQAESATNAFAASLRQIGQLSKGAVDDFKSYAQGLQETTGFSDDLIVQNAALLASIGNLSGKGLKDATKASLDLSQALQIDVGTAFDLVAKAAAGNTGALSRYGIKIDESIPKAQKWAKALELIQTRFGGLAATRLNTFEGSLQNLDNTFNDLLESIGTFITSSPTVRTVVNFIATSFSSLTKSLDKMREGGSDFLKPIILNILDFALAVNEYLIKPLELGFNLIRNGTYAIIAAVQGLIALFVNAGDAVLKYLIQPVIEGFGFIADKVVGLFSEEKAAKLKANIDSFASSVGGSLTTVADSTAAVFDDSFNALSDSVDNTMKSKVGSSIQEYIANMRKAVEETKSATGKMQSDTAGATANMATSWKVSIDSIKEGVRSGLSQTYQDMGRALQAGENLFEKFGQGIVGIIGDMLISIGNALILEGLAIESFITAITALLPGSGIAAAAAGAGLVIFGSALKASVGKGGSNSPSPTGGGVASSPSTTTELTPQEELTRAEPQTQVQLIVQGDILQTDDTAPRLIDLLNSAFDKKGLVLNQGVLA